MATTKLGLILRRFRETKSITQEKLAEMSGLHRVEIARLESGKRGQVVGNLNWETIAGLARAFGVSSDRFVAMIEAEQPEATKPEATKPSKPATKPRGKGKKQ